MPLMVSACSRDTMAAGVAAGTNSTNQLVRSKPGYSESSVGTSGSADERIFEVTAIPRIFAARKNGAALFTPGNAISVSPPISAFTAGAAPLYGICVNAAPVICWNMMPARWLAVPEPLEPKFNPPRVVLDNATRSFALLTGTDGCTDNSDGAEPICDTEIKSLRGSNANFGNSVTLAAIAAVVNSSV